MKNDHIEISKIEWCASLFQRLTLFQSFSQALSWISFVSGFMLLLYVFLLMFDTHLLSPTIFLISGFCSLWALHVTLPCKFTVTTCDDTVTILNLLEAKLSKLGYVILCKKPSQIQYQSKLPRWLRWKENVVVIAISNKSVEITAPKAVIAQLRLCLMNLTI